MSGGPVAATTPPAPARLAGVFEGLDRAGVRWSLLRSPQSLSDVEGDIDLLVHPADRTAAGHVVVEQGFAVVPTGRPDDLHAADYDVACDRFLWLHAQPALRVGRDSVSAATLLEAIRRDPLPRPPDPWLLWILILHGLLDKRAIAGRRRGEVQRLARDRHAPPGPLAAIAARHGLVPAVVLELAAAGDWEGLERLPLARLPGPPSLPARVRGAALRARRMWTRRGVCVAVIGPDGAGKTTLVESLRAQLPFGTYVLYMGLTGGRLPRADALRVPGLVLAARLAILWVRWAVGLAQRLRGHTVVFDRYVLDGTVPSGARLRPLARSSRRLQAHACPRPDLVLLLDASGDTLHARSGEYDAERLELWRTAYRRLEGRIDGLHVLDAERPADAVRRDALAAVWRCYAARWRQAA